MSMVLEVHNGETGNAAKGTLIRPYGATGRITYTYQVKDILVEVADPSWRRAYALKEQRVVAVWTRNPNPTNGRLKYVACEPSIHEEWRLPFRETPDARIAVAHWATELRTVQAARAWAERQFRRRETGRARIITAIVLDGKRVYRAWEMINDAPTLVARAPRS